MNGEFVVWIKERELNFYGVLSCTNDFIASPQAYDSLFSDSGSWNCDPAEDIIDLSSAGVSDIDRNDSCGLLAWEHFRAVDCVLEIEALRAEKVQ